jgi:hypothetical protein
MAPRRFPAKDPIAKPGKLPTMKPNVPPDAAPKYCHFAVFPSVVRSISGCNKSSTFEFGLFDMHQFFQLG